MSDTNEPTNELVSFFKALSDANRLKIIGLLAQEAYSVEQIASMLHLSPSTVSHHLSKLSEAGLVSARAESYYNIYSLQTKALEEMSQRLLQREALPKLAETVDANAYERKVLKEFTNPDGTVKAFPAQRKKLDVIVRYVANAFEFGQRYTEKQVNEILSHYNEDFATLRRELIDCKLMKRENGEYWRVDVGI
ncbi:MAG TPA: metalloregulator ArsR/SmtB family transcription factor [Longilinea sp.]|nr:metalloregulator ArsR/SmtB family transcription factor [Longilinea sp.]